MRGPTCPGDGSARGKVTSAVTTSDAGSTLTAQLALTAALGSGQIRACALPTGRLPEAARAISCPAVRLTHDICPSLSPS